jgi:hypothetical protein
MELSWTMKLRIAAVAAVGVIFVSILAWPWDSPPDPYGTLLVKSIGSSGTVTLLIMAFLAGLIAYFVAWPYGSQIGILAVPFGLAVWAVRSGSVAALVQLNPTFEQRQMLFETLRWEPFFWLLVVGAGFGGVTLGQKIRQGYKFEETQEKDNLGSHIYLYTVIALVGSVLLAQFCLKILAKDVILTDNIFSSTVAREAVAQPAVGQIVFAVLVSFGFVAFIVKKYLNVSYILPIISTSLITAYSTMIYIKPDVLEHYVESWPAVFFPNVVISLLPVQIVTFGTIGSIAGYWMAVRYLYWRKHEML